MGQTELSSWQGTSTGADTRFWYAVQAKRCAEAKIAHRLDAGSIPAFLPLIEVIGRRNGARHPRLEPLFPGYLFVQMDPPDTNPEAWDVVRWSPGVRRILGIAEEPVPVPDEAIRAIAHQVRDLGFVRPGARFAAGDPVRFRSGSMTGLEAVFDGPVSRTGRVRVLLALLGQVLRVEVDELDLDPV